MPRGFSEREKEHIHAALLEKGAELLATYGIRKTSVEDLTRAAGISKGAFYLFYDSKEELFLEIIGRFEAEYHASLIKAAAQPAPSARQQVLALLRQAFSLWKTHPLFTHFGREEHDYLLRKLPPDKIQAGLRSDAVFVAGLLEQWHAQGIAIDCDAAIFLNLMRALFFIGLHTEEFDQDAYPPMLDMLLDMIVERIVKT
jgi:AcrR family transcriptional regulator